MLAPSAVPRGAERAGARMADDVAEPRPRRVTSADVARATGVSRATVSYVVNDTPNRNISEATRRRVLEAARELGHVPNAAARALRSGRSNLVLVLVPGFAMGNLFDRALELLNDALAPRGYALLVHHHDERLRSISDLWRLVAPTLVVTMGGLDRRGMQAVDDSGLASIDVGGILSMPHIGSLQAAYLAGHGHRRIAFARPADPTLQQFADQRLSGVRAYCADHGLAEPLVVQVSDDAEAAVDACLADPGPVTAICAHNDDVALNLLVTLRQRGIGRDRIAVLGVDDIPAARFGLTTIAIDIDALSETIVELVVAQLDGRPRPEIDRPYLRVVERESA
jgi:DNA-binding LacI/PurR family transcriptional regulator